jgi:non-specific serine/threonine protein kinase
LIETIDPNENMESIVPAKFGDLLRRYRLATGLTQEELAERAKLSARAISDLERGARNHPWRGTVGLLATALDLEPGERAYFEKAARQASPPITAGLQHGVGQFPATPRHNLPIQVTSFVGRERALVELRERLATTHLLTLTGSGGCGKTRLALKVAEDLLAFYPDGVWLVDLAPVNDPALVPQAVAFALDVREVPGRPMLATVLEFLVARHLLLILDNCEHVVYACAQIADDVLQSCAQVHLLATSRELLGVRGETTMRVPSLALPELTPGAALAALRENEAIQLFIERARAVEPGFDLTKENVEALVRICQRLDGIPLALELAAARVRLLTVDQIATRLDDRFRLLIGGSRTTLRRQQTLRALIDWSHDLLAPEERILFRRLAVFAGGWSLAAAEAVSASDGLADDEVLDWLSGLVDKSLVVVEGQVGETRYHFLETVRAYAGEKLSNAGETASVRDRHRDWYVALAEQAEPNFFGPTSRLWIARLRGDYANVQAALEWCLEMDPDTGLRLVGSLWPIWFLTSKYVEGVRWLGACLERASATAPARGKALLGAGYCGRSIGAANLSQARAWTEECVALARAAEDRSLLARALVNLGSVYTLAKDYVTARAVLEESVALCREIGDRLWEGMSLRDLGQLARVTGDYGRAAQLYEESLANLRPLGHRRNILWGLIATGTLARQQHDPARARAAFKEGLAVAREEEDEDSSFLTLLRSLGELERSVGYFDEAERYLWDALVETQTRGTVWHHGAFLLYSYATLLLQRGAWGRGVRVASAVPLARLNPVNTLPSDMTDHDAAIQAARTALGETAFAAAWAEGKSTTLEQAVAYALSNYNPKA